MSFELVEKIEVGSGGVSQIEFTGIPQDADELVVFFSLRGVTATNAYGSFMYFNGETSSANVDYRIGYGVNDLENVTYAADANYYNLLGIQGGANYDDTFGSCILNFKNYTASNSDDPVIIHQGGASAETASGQYCSYGIGNYKGGAISSFKIVTSNASNYAQYSTAHLYKLTYA